MSSSVIEARTTALDSSGWGESFRFVQPRNLAFWVYSFLVYLGASVFIPYVARQAGAYQQAAVAAIVLFSVYGALFWWFTQRIDRYAHQSRKLIVVAFGWGAFGASWAIAATANTPVISIYSKLFGHAWALDWGAGLTASWTEEWSKGVGLLLLIALAPRLVSTAFDGFILGAFIGLGFQITEDIQYALGSAGSDFGHNAVFLALQTVLLRSVVGVAAHILYSAVFCAGLVYFLGRPAEPRRRGRGLLLMGSAMVLHGIWDDLGGLAGAHVLLIFVLWVVVIGVAVAVVMAVFRMTVAPERAYMRAVMAPEAEAGVITDEELNTLAGDRKARKAYRKAAHGHADRRRRHFLLEAGHDLADELAKAGGTDNDRVVFARSEVARIRG